MGRSVELLLILGSGFFIVGKAFQYLLQYWMGHFQKKIVKVPFWICGFAGIILSIIFIGWILVVWALIQYLVLKFSKSAPK